MNNYQFKALKEHKGLTIRIFLKRLGISTRVINDLTKSYGLILFNQKPTLINRKLKENDIVEIIINENEINEIIPINAPLEISYEDEHLLIVYKQKGIATIPSYCNFKSSLANFVTHYLKQKNNDFVFRALNRLDKDAEGFVVIAKNKLIYSLIKHNIQKIYTVFCIGKMQKKLIDLPIATIKMANGLNEIKRLVSGGGKASQTHILENEYFENLNISKCKVLIETGRTHQIRLHFASQGNFLLGDKLYGDEKINNKLKINSLQLYCNEIYVFHPILNKTIHLIQDISFPLSLE